MNPSEYSGYTPALNHGLTRNDTLGINLVQPPGSYGSKLSDWYTTSSSGTNVYVLPNGKILANGEYVVIGVQARLKPCVTDVNFMGKSTTFTTSITAAQLALSPWP
jgi:hypothetical protein